MQWNIWLTSKMWLKTWPAPLPPKKVEKAISTVHRQSLVPILLLQQKSILSVYIIGVMPIITPIQIYVPANSNANLFLFSNKNVNFSMLVRIKPLNYTFFFYNTLLRLLDYLKICQLFYLFKIFLNFLNFVLEYIWFIMC